MLAVSDRKREMHTITYVLQIGVALGLLNVWLLRFGQNTQYRGGNAQTMRQEFEVYGLPGWFTFVVGVLKVGAALCLLAGLWVHVLVLPAAALIGVLMLGALAMHLKVKDPWMKSLPALVVLVACGAICWISVY